MEKLGLENFYRSKRVLITGNTGFKGGWLTLWLSYLGADIKGFSQKPPTIPSFFELTKLDSCYQTINGDVRNFDSVSKVVKDFQPEIIFHLAAQPLVRYSYHNPLETYETNVMGTANLLEASKKSQALKTIINVTSDKCYENNDFNKSFKEGDRLGGNDPYSSSKACAEIISNSFFKSYFKSSEIQLATVRAGNVIGGGDWGKDRLIPDIYRALDKEMSIKLRNPKATRPWQHVLEPINGYLILAKLLFQGLVVDPNNQWNFGPEKDDIKSVEWVIKSFQKLNSKIKFDKVKSDLQESQRLSLDISKAKRKLDWHPKWKIKKTIEATHNWYEDFYSNGNMQQKSLIQISEYIKSFSKT